MFVGRLVYGSLKYLLFCTDIEQLNPFEAFEAIGSHFWPSARFRLPKKLFSWIWKIVSSIIKLIFISKVWIGKKLPTVSWFFFWDFNKKKMIQYLFVQNMFVNPYEQNIWLLSFFFFHSLFPPLLLAGFCQSGSQWTTLKVTQKYFKSFGSSHRKLVTQKSEKECTYRCLFFFSKLTFRKVPVHQSLDQQFSFCCKSFNNKLSGLTIFAWETWFVEIAKWC